ncbi:protein-S-isoprenylcysteine O-methyltransferase [uncultured Methylobacterium sp.]|uniref:protein-S-isoprenylcysteine O-methyltransferase n=1 Tax=uncultured Methylobacterium sp. TaxID=157278 RepID=UPI0035C9A15F
MLGHVAFLGLMVGWYVIRLPHLVRSRRTPVVASRRDLRERVLMAISGAGLGFVPLGYITFGFGGIGDRPTHIASVIAGIAVALLSLYLFRESHRWLGRQWSVSLELRINHKLQTDGIYHYVRHPMYAAFWLWALAQGLLLPNWFAGLSGLVGFGSLYIFRVPVEEQIMLDTFGDAYRDYAHATPRIIPRNFLPLIRFPAD